MNRLLSIGDLHEPSRSEHSTTVQVLVDVEMVAGSHQLVQTSVSLPLSLDLVQGN